MTSHRSAATYLVIVFILFILVACSALPASIRGLFATATPTPTATSTSTSTPTQTPTSTQTPTPLPTPVPPVGLNPCAFWFYCPDAINMQDLIDEEIQSGGQYFVEIPYDLPVHFRVGWVAIDEQTLQKNIENMRFFFDIDGQSYLSEAAVASELLEDADDPSIVRWTVGMGYVVDAWKLGEPHEIHIGFDFPKGINDGWDVYAPGTVFEHTFIITPVLPPTDTPVPTPTATITNTPRPQPTAIPATPTPACAATGSLRIINNTGGTVTLYMTGTAKFTFYVPTGTTTHNICPGSYSYTAYGCGGASINGTAKDGDEIEFWCE